MASGRNTISQRIALEGGKEIQDQLKGIGEAGERAFKQISGAASTVSGAGGQLAKGIDDAQKSMKEAQAAASKFGEGLASLGGAAGRAVTSLSALAGVATVSFAGVATALKGLAMSGAEAADAVGKSAMSLGLSVKEYGTLQFAAEQSGVAADQFGATMSRLNAQIEKTKDTTDPTTTALGKLGVKVTESNGELRPTSSILGDIAERFKAMPDGASKSAAAIEIFGRQAGPRLIPLLNEGRAGIAALTAEAEKSGLVFTELEVKFGTDMNDALSQMSRTAKATRDHIGLMFAPVIKEAADAVTEFLRDNQGAIQECGRSVVNVVAPVLRDIIKMMSGQGDDKIDTKWLLTIRDVFSGMGTAIRSTYDGLIAPTFREMKAIIDTLLIPIN
ncbi:MAG: tail tape measure protein core region, partial [Nocardioides sp.]|nr:tail tape measure protein core region [Nocardioides sp.]